jgi:hypothetical protein
VHTWIPAFEHVKNRSAAKSSPVMPVLDTAIQEKSKRFNGALDGRFKPGHDNRERFRKKRPLPTFPVSGGPEPFA